MNTIQSSWAGFRHTIPQGAGLDQRLQTKRAFYGGAWSAFVLITTRIAAMPAEARIPALNTLHDELQAFARVVGTPQEETTYE